MIDNINEADEQTVWLKLLRVILWCVKGNYRLIADDKSGVDNKEWFDRLCL